MFGSVLNNQDSMESKGPVFFFVAQLINVSFPTGFFVGASQFLGDSSGSPVRDLRWVGVGSVITNPS